MEKIKLSGTFDKNKYYKDAWFESQNTSIATVNRSSGTVTGINNGTTYIKFKINNGVKTIESKCKVTVKNAPSWVKLNITSIKLGVGEKITLNEHTNNESYANAKNLMWGYTSNVVSLQRKNGNSVEVTALKKGRATVTIRTYNNKTATCVIDVYNAPSSMKLSKSNITIGVGETFTISHSTNSGSYAKNFSHQIYDSSVAKIIKREANKYTIKGYKIGTTTFRVTTYNGKSATCTVKVIDSINKASISGLNNSYTYTGGEIKPAINIKYGGKTLQNGVDYTIEYKNNIKSYAVSHVSAEILITGKGSLKGSIKKYFTINQRDISNAKINLESYTYMYNKGEEVKPKITSVKLGNTTIYDYFIDGYRNNKKIGTGMLTIKGQNNNKGTASVTFQILKENPIVTKAKEIKKYIAENGYEYCLSSACDRSEHLYDRHSCGLTQNYEDSKKKGKNGYHNTCCATFVSWVLIDAGIIPQSAGSNTADMVAVRKSDKFYEQTSNFKASDIKAGDILIYTDGTYKHAHVEIAANDGATNNRAFVYNAGGYQSIHNEKNGGYSSFTVNDLTVKLRLK